MSVSTDVIPEMKGNHWPVAERVHDSSLPAFHRMSVIDSGKWRPRGKSRRHLKLLFRFLLGLGTRFPSSQGAERILCDCRDSCQVMREFSAIGPVQWELVMPQQVPTNSVRDSRDSVCNLILMMWHHSAGELSCGHILSELVNLLLSLLSFTT